ncbi:MAG: hypothetical protein HYW48_04900 [Deltaproteobacteria bacterium]|nr:hypothetical protein [Deltaproteobacteria bacterium]
MRTSFLVSIFAGVSLLLSQSVLADGKKDKPMKMEMKGASGAYEKCWGINSCNGHTACGVGKHDITAANKAFGDKYKSATSHSCDGKGACAGGSGNLGWLYVAEGMCEKIAGGFMITGEGEKKQVPEKYTKMKMGEMKMPMPMPEKKK